MELVDARRMTTALPNRHYSEHLQFLTITSFSFLVLLVPLPLLITTLFTVFFAFYASTLFLVTFIFLVFVC